MNEKKDVVRIQCNISNKKNEILPFSTTWMDLEGIMLSEISQRKTLYMTTYVLKNEQIK